ncbi:hypothetical protein TRIUR3_32514 [Triticum urartu]|uniref:Uncharacterized protein n=1 Tax=Triticum urartu TaxID=4572 RepID=M8AME1_TRIUA|nr:hypothetical protein TRIUR3_32514 [Triticum urartu]
MEGTRGGSELRAYEQSRLASIAENKTGIKSYARSRLELAEELGYDMQRDEIFVRAHTRKIGVPTAQAETLIYSHARDCILIDDKNNLKKQLNHQQHLQWKFNFIDKMNKFLLY